MEEEKARRRDGRKGEAVVAILIRGRLNFQYGESELTRR